MKKTFLSLAMLAMLAACGNKEAKTSNINKETNSIMTLDIEDFQWTREPESCVINGDTIEVVTKHTQTFGSEPTTTSRMITLLSFR